MSIDIVGVGTPRKSYKSIENLDFESLPEYLEHARRMIAHYAPKFRGGLAKEMLQSEDAVSNVATAIMMGDWRWDEDHTSEEGRSSSKKGYRHKCVVWAIKSYLSRKINNSENQPIYLSQSVFSETDSGKQQDLCSVLESGVPTSSEEALVNEEREYLCSLIDSSDLTAKQQNCVKLHYLEGMTLSEIAREKNISREAVRQSVSRGIEKIKITVSE